MENLSLKYFVAMALLLAAGLTTHAITSQTSSPEMLAGGKSDTSVNDSSKKSDCKPAPSRSPSYRMIVADGHVRVPDSVLQNG